MNNTYAIILAGGRGLRFGTDRPKQFLPLKDKPIILWSLDKFSDIPEINGIIVVTPEEYINKTGEIIQDYATKKSIMVIAGGETRQQSSYNAIISMNFNDDDILIFHDAVRPFISKEIILKCIRETEGYGAAGVYVRAIDTVTEIKDTMVQSIPDREDLYYAQTPQSFRYTIIRHAHEMAIAGNVSKASDDVSLVLNAGYDVRAVEGDYRNIKITTPLDYEIAQSIQEER
jgi:2-C-methyl-D-erythritol 4-phosphate cytidylyltransferase